MMKTKNTKRALLLSALSLVLCISMLAGSTFAWFTDSVTSGSNIIQSGKLEVALLDANGDSLEGEVIEWDAADGRAQNEILWEPGCTYNTEEIYVKNTGNLNLKFKLFINGITGDAKLLEVIDFTATLANQTITVPMGSFAQDYTDEFDMLNGVAVSDPSIAVKEILLEPNEMVGPIVLSGHMDENAGNEYMNLTVEGVSISVLATQAIGEADSFNDFYDMDALYPGLSSGKLEAGQSAVEIPIKDGTNSKIGSAVVPAGAVADPSKDVEARINPSEYVGNFTIAAGMTAQAYEINVTNLKAGNEDPVKITVKMEPGLDPSTVKLYHYDEEIHCTYDPSTGYLIFESTSFSPFTLVYDADSVYVPAPALPEDLPQANVVANPEYVGVDLPWGSYGQWSPTEGLEAVLDTAYTFTCLQSPEEAELSPYANWTCDFYVSLDQDLGANQIFLGGNYDPFDWVGFHNGDVTLAANEEIPMLGSVSGGWTYAQVAQNVGTFICGVGDVDGCLSGATFTVSLRLTNPENPEEFYNVQTVSYTFQ